MLWPGTQGLLGRVGHWFLGRVHRGNGNDGLDGITVGVLSASGDFPFHSPSSCFSPSLLLLLLATSLLLRLLGSRPYTGHFANPRLGVDAFGLQRFATRASFSFTRALDCDVVY